MNYDEALNYVLSLTNLENTRRFDLMKDGFLNVSRALKVIGVDYSRKEIIHVAGTKGKGSVSYFVSYLLSKFSGFKVGLFTSPHLLSINERISILKDGIIYNISDEDFAKVASIVRNFIERESVNLTTFDFLTVMAMYYFLENDVDIIVLEVGLGGRLDSTNFCNPKVSVITFVDYDHTNVLGKTLYKIAYEKAGIIKPNVFVVSSKQRKVVKNVIKEVSDRNNAFVKFVDEVYSILDVKVSVRGTEAIVKNLITRNTFRTSINLIGEHFVENLLVAYLAASYLSNISEEVFSNLDFHFKGRFEVLRVNPLVVFDVAHTPGAIDVAFKNYLKLVKGESFNVVVSIMEDKDIDRISKVFLKYRDSIDSIFILKLREHDGSMLLLEGIKSMGDKVWVVDRVEKIEKNTLIVGSFRIYSQFLWRGFWISLSLWYRI